MRYAIVIERGPLGFGAYALDLPGCVAAADTEDEVRELIRDAVALHVAALREHGAEIPCASTIVEYVEVATAA